MIPNWNRVHFLWRLGLFARGGGDDGAGRAQREAHQNNRDFHCSSHGLVSGLLHGVISKLLPTGANK